MGLDVLEDLTRPGASGDGRLRTELCNLMVQSYKRATSKGPSRARAYVLPDVAGAPDPAAGVVVNTFVLAPGDEDDVFGLVPPAA